MEKVITYDGTTTAFRKDCRFIKGAYYIKHKQCFYIADRWYRINSEYVAYDHESKEWILKSTKGLKYGIVKMSKNGEPEFGYFMEDINKNVFLLCNGPLECVRSIDVFEGKCSIKEGMNGHYYFSNDSVPRGFTTKMKPNKEGFYSFPFNYGSEPLIPEFLESFRKEYQGERLISDAYKYLNGYAFGVEFETERGAIPERYLHKSGLIACKDGSIAGFEYATIPLSGATGIQAIKTACDLLKKFCLCSVNESMHIHISGYPRTIKAIAALYILGLLIEDKVYAMFPYYYADTSKFKKKSYCGPLPSIRTITVKGAYDTFSHLYHWLSNGQAFGKTLPTGPHPMDRSGQHKWEISPRYVWLNMIPLIWGGRGTVEFRCHTPTVNAQKVINWLYITVAILKYARKHSTELTSKPIADLPRPTLYDIVTETYPKKISKILCKYIEDRTNYYKCKNDEIGGGEITSEEKSNEVFNLISFI